ncbi:hypothetical protein D9M70_465420 [compost metagenome]
MGVAAEDGIEPAHARGQLQVDVHAVVRQQHHRLRALAACRVDDLLQVFFLDAEGPVRHEIARVGDRRIGEGLADDGHRHAVDLADHVRIEHRVAEVVGLDVLRQEGDLALEVLVDDLLDAVRAERHFPVRRHHVDAQRQRRIDHVLPLGPERRGRALPGIAAIEQQRAWPARLEPLDQRGEVRKPADLAVAARGLVEIEVGERMRLRRAGADAVVAQQRVADQVRRLAGVVADAEVDVGFAEIHRPQLRMAVGEMQQVDVAEARQVVHRLGGLRGVRVLVGESHAAGAGDGQHLQELASVHVSSCG